MNSRERALETRGFAAFEVCAEKVAYTTPIDTNYNVVVLCDAGESELEINMQRMKLERGVRLVVSHVMLNKVLTISPDYHAKVLVFNDEFSLDMVVGLPTEMLEVIFSSPVYKVENEHEWTMLNHFLDNILIYDSLEFTHHAVEMVGAIYRCMVMAMAEIEMHTRGVNPNSVSYTMTDTYFRQFIGLIQQEVRCEHEVSFYARKLNITPKYLSEICKQKVGRKAKEIISNFLIAKLKRDIMLSGKSMKEIAFDYCFADQSSLGKFFRKMTGLSPSVLRKQNGVVGRELLNE